MAEQHIFADNITEHLAFLHRFVCRLRPADAAVEDIVQQTVLKALIHADQFRQTASLRSWLASIAINEVRQSWRSQWRTRKVVSITGREDHHAYRVVERPKDTYEAKEREVFLHGAVSRLPHIYRSVVELCDLERLPIEEAARILGITAFAVKARRHRARLKLRRLLTNVKCAA